MRYASMICYSRWQSYSISHLVIRTYLVISIGKPFSGFWSTRLKGDSKWKFPRAAVQLWRTSKLKSFRELRYGIIGWAWGYFAWSHLPSQNLFSFLHGVEFIFLWMCNTVQILSSFRSFPLGLRPHSQEAASGAADVKADEREMKMFDFSTRLTPQGRLERRLTDIRVQPCNKPIVEYLS